MSLLNVQLQNYISKLNITHKKYSVINHMRSIGLILNSLIAAARTSLAHIYSQILALAFTSSGSFFTNITSHALEIACDSLKQNVTTPLGS